MNKSILLGIGITAALFASCKKTDNEPVQTVPYGGLTSTTNYLQTFKGPDNNTSVDFSGQLTRINMLKEMDAYMKTGITATLDAGKIKNLFENKNSAFTSAELNAATDKTIVSKTAQSFSAGEADAERQRFYGYFDGLASASISRSQVATQGTAGLLDNKYLVNEKGFEYGQFIQKGLIGAMMLDQISNIYLGTEKQSADNDAIVSGKNYTQLEHHWDEAYGYLTQNEVYPKADPNDGTKFLESYLGSYVRQVGTPIGNPADVYIAFLKGRAAIVNNDAATRTAQIAYIRTALEKSIATIAISYLNKTKTAASYGAKFHALSEGVGFVYALRFGHNAKINRAKSDQLVEQLTGKTDGFWSLTNTDLENVRNEIANAFGIDKETVVNH
jgi:hypothetical protein